MYSFNLRYKIMNDDYESIHTLYRDICATFQ